MSHFLLSDMLTITFSSEKLASSLLLTKVSLLTRIIISGVVIGGGLEEGQRSSHGGVGGMGNRNEPVS